MTMWGILWSPQLGQRHSFHLYRCTSSQMLTSAFACSSSLATATRPYWEAKMSGVSPSCIIIERTECIYPCHTMSAIKCWAIFTHSTCTVGCQALHYSAGLWQHQPQSTDVQLQHDPPKRLGEEQSSHPEIQTHTCSSDCDGGQCMYNYT